jgi:hypothetical protein
MPELRRHRRIDDTHDMSVHLRSAGRTVGPLRVLNVSAGGLLVEPVDLAVGETLAFELHGPSFRYSGLARSVRTAASTAGLQVLAWEGQAHRPLRELIDSRRAHTPTLAGASSPS